MNRLFSKWIEENRMSLYQSGISTETINVTPDDIADPSTTVDHCSDLCVGRVSVWSSGLMDFEVLDFETGERLLFEHQELDEYANFDTILSKYISIMKTGKL